MKHLFDFNEKRKIRLLQMTNSQKKLFEKGGRVGVRMWVRVKVTVRVRVRVFE
jgi:hypothetical protein